MKRMVMSPKIKGMAVVPNMKHTAMARGIKKMAASSRMKHRAMKPERANMWMAGAMGMMAAGAGAAVMMAPKKRGQKKSTPQKQKTLSQGEQRFYYSKGNYEAFARPKKPEGIDERSAWLIGGGLASLAAACFLIRDAGMAGERIHILEASDLTGGACDGIMDPTRGYIMRAAARWRIILNVFGICSDRYPPLIRRELLCWMNFTG